MKKCPKCGAQINDDDKFCIFCGENVENIGSNDFGDSLTCKYCHNPIKKEDIFCQHCGMEIKGGDDDFFNNSQKENERISEQGYHSIWETIPNFFKNIVNFKGRATRRDYWFPVILLPAAISLIYSILVGLIPALTITYNFKLPQEFMEYYGDILSLYLEGDYIQIDVISNVLDLLLELAFIPLLVRRLRDAGKNPWCIFVYLIPVVGPILILIWTLAPTDRYRY